MSIWITMEIKTVKSPWLQMRLSSFKKQTAIKNNLVYSVYCWLSAEQNEMLSNFNKSFIVTFIQSSYAAEQILNWE